MRAGYVREWGAALTPSDQGPFRFFVWKGCSAVRCLMRVAGHGGTTAPHQEVEVTAFIGL